MTTPVWIIDGSLVVRKILEISLRRAGIASTSYSDGIEALRELHHRPADASALIILEVLLPYMDGYDVTIQVREKLSRQQTAIVMLSKCDGVLDRIKGRLAGADAYLTKPFLVADVQAAVRTYLGKGRPLAR